MSSPPADAFYHLQNESTLRNNVCLRILNFDLHLRSVCQTIDLIKIDLLVHNEASGLVGSSGSLLLNVSRIKTKQGGV